jgi:hypothetical protein
MIKSRLKWVDHVACMGEMKSAYKILVGRPKGRRPIMKPTHRWEDNIRMVLRKIGWEGVDWMCLAQDWDQWQVLMNMLMDLLVP